MTPAETIHLLRPYRVAHLTRQRFPASGGDGTYVVPVPHTANCQAFYCLGVGNGTPLEEELNRQMPDKTIHLYDAVESDQGRWFDKVKNAHLHIQEVTDLDEIIPKSAKNIFLKMDIEGDEWNLLSKASDDLLERVDVLLVEFHNLQEVMNINLETFHNVWKRVNEYFTPIHIHGNNYSWLFQLNEVWFPAVVEMTYLNNRLTSKRVPSDEKFPTPIDLPNCAEREEFPINFPAPQALVEDTLEYQ